MNEYDYGNSKPNKSNVVTGSLTCFQDNKTRGFSSSCNLNTAIVRVRGIATGLHSIAIGSNNNALINDNMDQAYLVLDVFHNNRSLSYFTAISPCPNTATVPGRPLFHGDHRKCTPEMDCPYNYHQHRSDIQPLCCIFLILYRVIECLKVYYRTRNIYLLNEAISYFNNDLLVKADIFQFPNWTPLGKPDLSECIRCIPVLDDHNSETYQVVMRPSVLHELLFALLVTLACTVTPSGLQGHDQSVGGFNIFSSPYVNKMRFLDKATTDSGNGGSGSNGKTIKHQETLFSSYCSKVLEVLLVFCSASSWNWQGFGRKNQVEGWSLRSFLQLVLGTVDPWILECKRHTQTFFTVIDEHYGVQKKLSDGGPELANLYEILRSSRPMQGNAERQAPPYRKQILGTTQGNWSQSHGDAIMKTLKSFDGDSDIGDIAVNILLELLKSGQDKWNHNKSLAKNALRLVKMFAHTMMSVQSNSDFQPQILHFMHLIQHITGVWSTDVVVDNKYMDKATQTSATIEENSGLQKTVDQLKDALRTSEEMINKMRQEKMDLETKIRNQDSILLETQQQNQRPTTEDLTVIQESVIPAPPPPPPMPNFNNTYNERKSRSRSSSKSSTYFHPLDLNLTFTSLKSLHENAPTSPTSPVFDPTIKGANVSESSSYQQITTNQTPVQPTPTITMKQFFWSKLPRERIQNTVWKEMSSDESTSKMQRYQQHGNKFVELDIVELEKLFKKTQNVKKQTSGEHQGLHATMKLRKRRLMTLLEFNRANNIAIMLARIKLTYTQICDSIWTIDDHRLNVDNLMAIRQYIPTKEEIEMIQDYTGDSDMLGNAEQYFKAIMDIPRLTDRIDCIIFRRKFHHEVQELLPELNILQLAIRELRHSHQFKLILKTILAIGNHLNDHTIRGNAYGFHIDALLKMGDTKTEDGGDINLPTLLHYLVFFLSKTGQQVVDTFKDGVPHLESAAQISPPTLFASVKTLDGNLCRIRKELAICQQNPKRQKMDRFTELMKTFLEEAEPIVENVKSLAKDIQERLKDLIMYYGEDPTLVKPQDFFSIICTFSSSFEKAKVEIEQARQKALRRQQDASKKLTIDSVAPATLSPIVSKGNPTIGRNLARSSLRAVTTTTTRDNRSDNEGFGHVLQELRAGLKRVNVPLGK